MGLEPLSSPRYSAGLEATIADEKVEGKTRAKAKTFLRAYI